MNISSLIVRTHPDRSALLRGRLSALSGVEVHAATEDGSLVVTVEDTPDAAPADTLMSIRTMRGVLSASLIYNYCDDL